MIALRRRPAISRARNNDFARESYTADVNGLRPLLFLMTLLGGLAAGTGVRARGFVFLGVSNRFLTPNGDGRNDDVTFRFSNPRDSAGTVRIYDVRGHEIASLPVVAGRTSATWDGRSGGRAVDAGVYVFVIKVESVTASGTVVVIR